MLVKNLLAEIQTQFTTQGHLQQKDFAQFKACRFHPHPNQKPRHQAGASDLDVGVSIRLIG
jgi:hypothetical protein